MNDHVYSVTEIIGTSKTSVEDAIQQGIKAAAETLRNLEWFEVTQIKGHIVDGGVGHYQVCMKLGLRYEPTTSAPDNELAEELNKETLDP